MARKKMKLEWIANDSARKATLKKRKKGLMKKVSELSTLCDVKACAIVYAPDEPDAEAWPSVPDAMRVVARLKQLPKTEQSKNMMDQEALMRQSIRKLQEQLEKQEKENRELETALLMHQCLEGRSLHDVAIEDATKLAWMAEVKMNEVQGRLAEAASRVAEKEKDGDRKGKTPMAVAEEEFLRHDWFREAMELGELIISKNDAEVQQPNVDHRNPWSNAYFP